MEAVSPEPSRFPNNLAPLQSNALSLSPFPYLPRPVLQTQQLSSHLTGELRSPSTMTHRRGADGS